MSFSETRLPGLQVHVEAGGAYPYTVPFTQAQLAAAVTPLPGLNILPILPAGSVISLNGLLYRTIKPLEAGTPGPQIGAIVPLGPPRPSVIGPKDTSTFTDRVNVFWDTVNNVFTSTISATTVWVGYAVVNPLLGSATSGTGSSLTVTPSTNATEYNAVATVTGGTSADGQVGAYATGDAYMEVELAEVGQFLLCPGAAGTGTITFKTISGSTNYTSAGWMEINGVWVPYFSAKPV